jgi:hypothetical protein
MQKFDKLEKRTIKMGLGPQDRRKADCSRASESFFGKGGGWVAAQFLVMMSWVALTPKGRKLTDSTLGRVAAAALMSAGAAAALSGFRAAMRAVDPLTCGLPRQSSSLTHRSRRENFERSEPAVVGFNDCPGREFRVGFGQHILRCGKIFGIPFMLANIVFRHSPGGCAVCAKVVKSAPLFRLGDVKKRISLSPSPHL